MSSQTGQTVGIDLGTTYSVVAYLDRSGKPQTVMNMEGDLSTPSVVYFDDEEVVVGKEAVKAAIYEPESVVQSQQFRNALADQLFASFVSFFDRRLWKRGPLMARGIIPKTRNGVRPAASCCGLHPLNTRTTFQSQQAMIA